MQRLQKLALLAAMLAAALAVAVTTGCGSEDEGNQKIEYLQYPKDTNAAAALLAGKVDAYFADATPVLHYLNGKEDQFEVAGEQIDAEPEGIATRKGDPLGAKFEQAIAELYANGEMERILAEWNIGQFALEPEASGEAGAEITPPENIASAGKIVFCSDTSYPPMESLEGGKAVGADVDIANAVAELMGVEAEIKTTGFDVIIPALLANKCDAIISALTNTPERAEKVDFADYVIVGSLLMVKKGNPEDITDLESLRGKTVAVQAGTTQKDMLDEANEALADEG